MNKRNSKEESLAEKSKLELIDSALLQNVSGGNCEVWVETCGCADCCDWCGEYRPKTIEE